jgi:hypothetical protein
MRRVSATAAVLAIGMAAVAGCGSGDTGPAETFRSYIEALNKHDGATVCQSLVPEATAKLRPPVKRETCAEAITDSIGHRRPDGSRWRSASVKRVSGSETLDVTVENSYAGGKTEPERETVKMRKSGDTWLLTEPDQTLYYAIGQK